MSKKNLNTFNSIPVRCKAFHHCIGSEKSVLLLILPVLRHMAGKYYRLHSVRHTGTDSNFRTSFAVYGLTEDHVNIMRRGTAFAISKTERWIDEQRVAEEQN